jgi:hypothetical protein
MDLILKTSHSGLQQTMSQRAIPSAVLERAKRDTEAVDALWNLTKDEVYRRPVYYSSDDEDIDRDSLIRDVFLSPNYKK